MRSSARWLLCSGGLPFTLLSIWRPSFNAEGHAWHFVGDSLEKTIEVPGSARGGAGTHLQPQDGPAVTLSGQMTTYC